MLGKLDELLMTGDVLAMADAQDLADECGFTETNDSLVSVAPSVHGRLSTRPCTCCNGAGRTRSLLCKRECPAGQFVNSRDLCSNCHESYAARGACPKGERLKGCPALDSSSKKAPISWTKALRSGSRAT